MSEQQARLDTAHTGAVPPKAISNSHFEIRFGGMTANISKEMVEQIQQHSNRMKALGADKQAFAIVTDSHLGRYKFIIRDANQQGTFFAVTYRFTEEKAAEDAAVEAINAILNIIL